MPPSERVVVTAPHSDKRSRAIRARERWEWRWQGWRRETETGAETEVRESDGERGSTSERGTRRCQREEGECTSTGIVDHESPSGQLPVLWRLHPLLQPARPYQSPGPHRYLLHSALPHIFPTSLASSACASAPPRQRTTTASTPVQPEPNPTIRQDQDQLSAREGGGVPQSGGGRCRRAASCSAIPAVGAVCVLLHVAAVAALHARRGRRSLPLSSSDSAGMPRADTGMIFPPARAPRAARRGAARNVDARSSG
jgi:hypothetical protein